MNKLNIDMIFNGIKIHADFDTKFGILVGDSGTGKTLLMKAIDLYCLRNKIKYYYLNDSATELSKDQILSILSDKHVALLDNADLYLTNDILEVLQKDPNKFVLICMKDTSRINTRYATEYFVNYSNKFLTIEEF